MAYAASAPGRLLHELLRNRWESGNIRAVLLRSTYTPNPAAHVYASDLALGTHENVGSGYTAGGAALTGKTAVYDAATKTTFLRSDPANWPGVVSATWQYMAVLDAGAAGTPATQQLVFAVLDYVAVQAHSGGALSLEFDADGVLKFIAA